MTKRGERLKFAGLAARRTLSGRARRRLAVGQSLVELVVVLPVLLLILVVAVDLGRVYLGWVTLNNAARIGADFAATNPSAWEGSGNAALRAKYQQLMMNDAQSIDCTLPNPLPAPAFLASAPNTYIVGGSVRVTLPCSFHLITPFIDNLIGDGAGNVPVTASTTFSIRVSYAGTDPIGGGGNPTPTPGPTPTAAPTPTPTATPTPTPTPTPDPSASPVPPTPTPSPSPTPPIVTFYGTPSGVDSYGGGPPTTPPGPNENQIVGIPGLSVTFTNTTAGAHGSCQWIFGDGGTSNSCANSVNYTYSSTTRTTYDVGLSIDGGNLTRTGYVLISCKVPAFSGMQLGAAISAWTNAGFDAQNFSPTNGNFKVVSQSLAGGLVGPPGGCTGATVTVSQH